MNVVNNMGFRNRIKGDGDNRMVRNVWGTQADGCRANNYETKSLFTSFQVDAFASSTERCSNKSKNHTNSVGLELRFHWSGLLHFAIEDPDTARMTSCAAATATRESVIRNGPRGVRSRMLYSSSRAGVAKNFSHLGGVSLRSQYDPER